MIMKLSELNKYREYMFCLVEKKYNEAEQALKLCIQIAKAEKDKDALIFFIQNMGDLYFVKNDKKKAVNFYAEAEKIDKNSPLAKYQFAKFLTDKLKQYDQAIEKCSEVIEVASAKPWTETEYDFNSTHYLARCYALQGYCYCMLKNFKIAGEKLLQLLELNEKNIVDYSVALCDLLITNGYAIDEAKGYLNHLLVTLTDTEELRSYEGLISHVKEILNK